jgi:hypothetical protein
MSLLEMRLALYLLGTLLFNGITIVALVAKGGWSMASLPLIGTLSAILYGRILPRREARRPAMSPDGHDRETSAQ